MVKNLPANAGDAGTVSGLGRSAGEGSGNPLHYPCLEKTVDREVQQATVHGVPKVSDTTQLLNNDNPRVLFNKALS